MIYGLNFNGTRIPDNVLRRFAKRKRYPQIGQWARLQGACNTDGEAAAMLMQADNGHRQVITWVGPRTIDGQKWYGVYVS